MAAQEIDLSPRKILNYLKDFEDKLPPREYHIYVSSLTETPITDTLLNSEARKMMEFVGLKGYEPICTFGKTEDGVGGCVDMTNQKDNLVHIRVSEDYRNNRNAVLAVLAHEICHKLLFLNNIYTPLIPIMNEVYCDLCTIYVGFGDIILNGYNTKKGNTTHILGYLKPYVYDHAYKIAKVLLDGKENLITENFSGDIFLDAAFQTWTSSADKRKVFLDTFADIQDEYSELNRNILLLHQILEKFKDNYKTTLSLADDYFFGRGDFFEKGTNRLLRPINAFAAIYENEPTKDMQEMVDKSNVLITDLMVKLIDECEDFDINALKYGPYTCPFCGTESQNTSFNDRKAIVRCNKCGRHFHINCEPWNIIAKRRDMYARIDKVEQERNHVIAQSIDQTINKLPNWLKWIAKKYIDF